MKMRAFFPSLILLAVIVSVSTADQRGRPYLSGGTLVADNGHRLRGCYISTDYYHYNQSEIRAGTKEGITKAATEYGMNAFHFYCGWYATPTGTYQPLADSLVKWTREAGVYLVMTIGGWDKNGEFSIDKVREFWQYYAPRYADETHVIYEVMNEPEFICNNGSAEEVISMELEACDTIRKYAPDTHILLMSYGSIPNLQYFEQDLQALRDGGINFDNESIAYHGYHWCAHARKHTNPQYAHSTAANIIPQLQEQGYSFFNTEFQRDSTLVGSDEYSGQLIEFYENDLEISWLCFYAFPYTNENAKQNLFNPNTQFKTKVEEMGAAWCPDHGTWPLDPAECETFTDANVPSPSPVGSTSRLKLYPNPFTHGTLYMTLAGSDWKAPAFFSVYDLVGRRISHRTIVQGASETTLIPLFDRESVADGSYLVRIEEGGRRHRYRLLVR